MPRCDGCGSDFPNIIEVDGKMRWLHRRKFCLVCSPIGERRMSSVPRTEDGKRCSSCRLLKPFSEFWAQKKSSDGLSYKCQGCSRRDSKVHIDLRRREIYAYLAKHPCQDCGEADPIVLQFDHVRGTKVSDVSRMVSDCKPIEDIFAEIAKCDVVCGNCHKRRTVRQFRQLPWLEAARG